MTAQESLWAVSALIACLVALAVYQRLRHARWPFLGKTPSAAARARQRAPSKRRLHTEHPIVLAHGWGGIDGRLTAQLGYSYFRGIPEALRDCGHRVYVARVSPTASIGMRAKQLARQIERLDARVNIVAHSMGGLDARLAIARYGLAQRVASLTTLGTPHHGTPLADLLTCAFGDWPNTRKLLRQLGMSIDGVYDVSTARMREFNRLVQDQPGVHYGSVVASADMHTVHALLSLGHRYIEKVAGPNDGVVPELSQRWGDTLEQVTADHWAQIGWSARFDVHSLYNRIARRLAARDL